MISWRTRRKFARLVSRVPLPTDAGIEALCVAVAHQLDRPIRLLPLPLPVDAPCGLVVTTKQAHYVAYDNQTTPLHQRHIVAHELGHLLAGHTARSIGETELSRLLMPTLDPRMVATALPRVPGYDVQAEAEAEIIADLLWRHTARLLTETPRPSVEPGPDVDPRAAAVVERIRRSLTGE